jgi:hypothetical protein
MKKRKITVYDCRAEFKESPLKIEADAFCVGGECGVAAFFINDGDRLIFAAGDDGNWWVADVCHKAWLPKIKEAIDSLCEEEGVS